jgi:hypothetical protein
VIDLIVITKLGRISWAWWKSNITNDYRDMTHLSLHTRSSRCIICLIHVKKQSAWWVLHKVNPRKWLHTLEDTGYHGTPTLDDDVDEVYQKEELPPSFVVDPDAALDGLVGDADNIEMSVVKRKWKPIKKKVQLPILRTRLLDHDADKF